MDKAFDGKPMIVVVSNSLDPRTQRQLQAQLQADTWTAEQLEAQLEASRNAETVKEELAKTKDLTVDDIETDDKPDAIEGDKGAEVNKSEDNPFGEDVSDKQETSEKKEEKPDTEKSSEEDIFSNNSDKPEDKPKEETKPEAASTEKPADNKDTKNEEAVFESYFMSIRSGSFKHEDAYPDKSESNIPTGVELPPIKRLIVVKGTNAGVDDRTHSTVGTLEDPKNTVVVIDKTEVDEVDIKIQFENLKDHLQKEGVMVVDSVDDSIDYLNTIYEQLPKK